MYRAEDGGEWGYDSKGSLSGLTGAKRKSQGPPSISVSPVSEEHEGAGDERARPQEKKVCPYPQCEF